MMSRKRFGTAGVLVLVNFFAVALAGCGEDNAAATEACRSAADCSSCCTSKGAKFAVTITMNGEQRCKCKGKK